MATGDGSLTNDIETRYVAKFHLDRESSTPGTIHVKSMTELCEWANCNNMIFGTPRRGTPYFSVTHRDGDPLNVSEREIIVDTASRDNYLRRQAEGIAAAGGSVTESKVVTPEVTDLHGPVGRYLNKKRDSDKGI